MEECIIYLAKSIQLIFDDPNNESKTCLVLWWKQKKYDLRRVQWKQDRHTAMKREEVMIII